MVIHTLNLLKYTIHLIGEGSGTPPQYSCLENPMDGGAWQAAHGVPKSQDTTERLSTLASHILTLWKS